MIGYTSPGTWLSAGAMGLGERGVGAVPDEGSTDWLCSLFYFEVRSGFVCARPLSPASYSVLLLLVGW